MSKLVSILIPCFNAERWLAEAIESCLNQTYSNIEIIIIDDGSTDRSPEIIKQYSSTIHRCRIISKFTPNRGGNHARNLAFSLSHGDYIQYLDADDYILPEKIEKQVNFLEAVNADIVYGDWRRLYHQSDSSIVWGDPQISGEQSNLLERLLANDWWVAVAAFLYRRESVEKIGGWDENLTVAQDRDFFLRCVLSEAQVVYQSGCDSIYRYYGNVTVSTRSHRQWLYGHITATAKAEKALSRADKLTKSNRDAIARSYLDSARGMVQYDFHTYLSLVQKIATLDPSSNFNSYRFSFKAVQSLFGFERAEKLVGLLLLTKIKMNSRKGKLTQWLQLQKDEFSTQPSSDNA
ncbi:MAG: glycosyltransferase [Kaiparowitsia implicata GSE-PSE-MK54-09C]|jgi:glycosyltransferase involved in cell wall biosynthesis|nr:glycosyltransferase [Kaiparowitsia implicata GSE-PSE-MK54-09C]